MADESKESSPLETAKAAAQQCLAWDPNPALKAQTKAMLEAADASEAGASALVKSFGKRISFGTAGLRGRMACGTANMNDLSVLQATQGLCAYALAAFPEDGKERGFAIGYDHRCTPGGEITSERLALLAAAVFRSKGARVYLYSDIVCTPMVPFMVDAKRCVAGIMVTASHNPKEDDGYKVYWANGSQIVPPHDNGIAAAIMENLEPWQAYDLAAVRGDSGVVDLRDSTGAAYIDAVAGRLCRHKEANAADSMPVTYTAMHGVGQEWVLRAFEAFGHPPPVCTKEQGAPDPTFPTVAYPNPEEGKGALALAMATADAAGSRLILANDPDADRLAVAEKQEDGTWFVFSGNDIGLLLGNWEWRCFTKANPDADLSKVVMLASTVSSKALGAMARYHGFRFEDTLTGFKWMGTRAAELRAAGETVLFSYEEAIGFCVGDVVKDKDGVSAAAVFAEMTKQLRAEGHASVKAYLGLLRERYGYFLSSNAYLFTPADDSAAVLKRIFERLRNGGHYWLACGKYAIRDVRDLESPGRDTSTSDGRPTLPVTSAHMLTYYFRNGCVATLRPSGTEPKIKWYIELAGESPEAARVVLDDMAKVIVEEMLEPAKNGLSKKKA